MEDYVVIEEEYRGYNIKIYQDCEMEENPAQNWDMLSTFVLWHKNYDLATDDEFDDQEVWQEWWKENKKDVIILPIYMYDHSGQTIRTTSFHSAGLPQGHAQFDSGQLGWVFITKQKACKEFDWKYVTAKREEKLKKILISDTATYDQYIRGDIYGYVVKSSEGEIIDSCAGFYGTDYIIAEAKSTIKDRIKVLTENHFRVLKGQIKTKLPLMYRRSFQLT